MPSKLSSSITATFGAPSYPVNPGYYAKPAPRLFYQQPAARPFYASVLPRAFDGEMPARPFYAVMPLRAFYVKTMPTLNQIPTFNTMDPRETIVLTFDATLELATGETLTGTPTVGITTQSGTDLSTPALVLSDAIVNSEPITLLNGNTVAAGCAAQVVATGGLLGSQYLVALTTSTSNPNKVLTLKASLPMATQ